MLTTVGDRESGPDAVRRDAHASWSHLWSALLPVGLDSGSGGYRRFAWTDTDRACREWFAQEAARRGLDLVVDRDGNQWAWWGDPDAAGPGVVTGSHLDSVPDGGAYDGPLGVISAFAALDLLRGRGMRPRRPIAVAAFSDEEGARFGVSCVGSRLLTGELDADRARSLVGIDGTTLADAMRTHGHDPSHVGRDDETLARVGVFVELHVEQGRALVDMDRAVGVASSIWPHGRWRFDLGGEANHAGTTRLADRRDPMLALARTTLAARDQAEAHDALATVGRVHVEPNGTNAIPSLVQAWLDARGSDEQRVRDLVAAVAAVAGADAVEESYTAAVDLDPPLRERLAGLLDDAPVLPTGAGHDAGILATAGITAAMLFVRNPTGVSHSPAEHADEHDCVAGVIALASVLEELSR